MRFTGSEQLSLTRISSSLVVFVKLCWHFSCLLKVRLYFFFNLALVIFSVTSPVSCSKSFLENSIFSFFYSFARSLALNNSTRSYSNSLFFVFICSYASTRSLLLYPYNSSIFSWHSSDDAHHFICDSRSFSVHFLFATAILFDIKIRSYRSQMNRRLFAPTAIPYAVFPGTAITLPPANLYRV
jgi:hypothetical protein